MKRILGIVGIAGLLAAGVGAPARASSFGDIGQALRGALGALRGRKPVPAEQNGVINWGQIRVPEQPPVPQEVLARVAKIAVDQVAKAPHGYPGLPDPPNKVNYGPDLSGGIQDDAERGIAPYNAAASKLIIQNYPRVVLATRQVPILGYEATIRYEAYPIYENGAWSVYVLQRWLRPQPHLDEWNRVELPKD